ncbi:MAG: PQQ-binding-like beta-propeller repeat protein [Sphingomonas adhaesiva]|uniref:outer membrane protein assembly factor BamB family protein n=1 Tax=Sphingomonas adhaesiva TaxID=28212 RepID=UPI002FF96522
MNRRQPRRTLFLAVQTAAGLLGLAMAVLGAWLILLGGTVYYLVAGLLLLTGCAAAWSGRHGGAIGAGGLALLLTAIWAMEEIAGKGWMPAWGFDLAGRIGLPAALVIGSITILSFPADRRWDRELAIVGGAALLAAGAGLALFWERPTTPHDAVAAARGPADTDWTAFGGTNAGMRYSPATQITPTNVGGLREAWRFHTGDLPPDGDRLFFSAQNTPLKVGDTLYLCSARNRVFALDPATGREKWRYEPRIAPRALESTFSVACRAVGYHANAAAPAGAACAARVFVAVADGRLVALDARTGRACTGFGRGGTVDLTRRMGLDEPGHASSNSGPAVIGDMVIVGQQVSDNQRRDAPSGVVRAYDATTGALRWAWDAKRPDARAPLPPGATWPEGTPNVWNVISGDAGLGLVLLATGNAGNDHWGGNRDPEDDRFSSAVVAVDLATGATRWVFRTVERDRFDYDLGAQPVLTTIPVGGVLRRVVVQGTKTGSLFVLDAATGLPVRPVAYRPAPGGGMPGDRLSPVQPQSVAYPNLSGRPGADPEQIDARHAFGLTPIDAAWCRIQFHRMRYEGIYTPPTDRGMGTLLFPGTIGGLNWGGLAIDPVRGIVVTNHSRLPNRVKLFPRAAVAAPAIGDGGRRPDQAVAPQKGAPWAVDRPMWLSPLGVPCIAPPWGYLAATDLATGRLLWSQPFGTGRDSGPLGLPSMLRIPIGTPNLGGAVTTATDLSFIAATQDDYIRAYETASGRLLWSARLPAGGQASAMTYMHRGRQYVAISATGHARFETRPGDALIVYALP